eukprot:3071106-Rhodomonas_salina.1
MVLVLIMLLSLLAPAASSFVAPSFNSTLAGLGIYNTNTIALAVFGISGATADTYFIDSGCTRTICCNACYMRNLNLRHVDPVLVKGLTGFKSYYIVCDLHFPLVSDTHQIQTLVIENALFDPSGDINLIASDNINATLWDVNLSASFALWTVQVQRKSVTSCRTCTNQEVRQTSHPAD